MADDDASILRERATRYRERADTESLNPIVREAFYQIAQSLESRAAARDAARAIVDISLARSRRR